MVRVALAVLHTGTLYGGCLLHNGMYNREMCAIWYFAFISMFAVKPNLL